MILLQLIWIVLLIQWCFASIAILWKTDKVTDLSYGLTFVVCVLWLFFSYGDSLMDVTLTLVICLRGVRLAGYLFVRILAIGTDKRFDGIREKPRSFGKFWLLQAVIIILLLLPTVIVMWKDTVGFQVLSMMGTLVSLGWIAVQTLADFQKYQYKRQNPHHRVDTGLWKKSRHPNYFGEMLMRWWVFVACIPVLSGREYLSVISPLSITRILLFVTWIPPLEEQWEKKYWDQKEFQDWKEKTNILWLR